MDNNNKTTPILGFDEVGRGPLAGPMVIACVLDLGIPHPKNIIIRDSKKMTAKQRELSREWIIGNFPWAIAEISANEIDSQGLSQAIKTTSTQCLQNFSEKYKRENYQYKIFIDGNSHWFENDTTVIKGDDLIPAISMASIIAKVYRDKQMSQLDEIYPDWKFGQHVGYGTAFHIQQIEKYGLIEGLHRKSFCKRWINTLLQ